MSCIVGHLTYQKTSGSLLIADIFRTRFPEKGNTGGGYTWDGIEPPLL